MPLMPRGVNKVIKSKRAYNVKKQRQDTCLRGECGRSMTRYAKRRFQVVCASRVFPPLQLLASAMHPFHIMDETATLELTFSVYR